MNFIISVTLLGEGENIYLVANENVNIGDTIWNNKTNYDTLGTGKATLAEINSWPEEKQNIFKRHCWAIDWDMFVGCVSDDPTKDLTNYINHSCDPSCWFVDDNTIVAKKDIKKGDKITIEYATVDHKFVEFDGECDCNSVNCRKIIKNNDYQLLEIKEIYKDNMMNYLRKLRSNPIRRNSENI